MTVFSAVDDTKLVAKAIIGEMAENMAEIASTQYGRKVCLPGSAIDCQQEMGNRLH